MLKTGTVLNKMFTAGQFAQCLALNERTFSVLMNVNVNAVPLYVCSLQTGCQYGLFRDLLLNGPRAVRKPISE